MTDVWQLIFKGLKKELSDEGIEIYPPATRQKPTSGGLQKPYVVIKRNGGNKADRISSQIQYYDVLVYVPRRRYSKIGSYKVLVKNAMKTLYPMIKPMNSETPPFLDEEMDAWMVSVQYKNYVKL